MYFQHLIPNEILEHILSFCDPPSLRALNQTCKRIRDLVLSHRYWLEKSKHTFVTEQTSLAILYRSHLLLSPFDKCRIERNWTIGRYKYSQFFTQRTNYMPWLQLDTNFVWIAFGKHIKAYRRIDIQTMMETRARNCRPYYVLGDRRKKGDVSRFFKKNSILLWNQNEYITAWCENREEKLFEVDILHLTDNQFLRDSRSYIRNTNDALDFGKDLVVFSVNNATYITSFAALQNDETVTVSLWDRECWRLRIADRGRLVVGASRRGPMFIYDAHTGEEVLQFGGLSFGDTAVDLYWHDDLLLTAGYNSKLCLWDPRTPCWEPVLAIEDPFDSTFYCISTDAINTVVCGLQMNARANSYDLRVGKIVQAYYMDTLEESPIYSLSFDPSQLFCATSRCVHLLDFYKYEEKIRDYREWLVEPHILA